MWDPGLTPDEFGEYLDVLRTDHERDITVDVIRRRDEKFLGPLDMHLLDGQVNYDATGSQATTRILNLAFLDLTKSAMFDPDGGRRTHMQYLLRVKYAVRVPALNRWVETPVHKGPMHDVDRDGAEVHVTCRGMEEIAKANIGRAWALKKKTRKTVEARDLLRACGFADVRIRIPHLRATFPDTKTLKYDANFWDEQARIARSLGYYTFPDGAGNIWWRRLGYRPVLTFARELLDDPKPSVSGDDLANAFRCIGGDPKGPNGRPSYTAYFPEDDPNSMQGLAYNGHWNRRIVSEENDHWKTQAAVKREAIEMRDEALRKLTATDFSIIPNPILEEYDMVAAAGPDGPRNTRAWTMTLPLGGSEPGLLDASSEGMAIGAQRRTMKAA